jgi:UDP-glucose 4-epimerase
MEFELVTGGAGFIGSHLVEKLLVEGKNVIVLDNLSMGRIENLPKSDNLIFINGDVGSKEKIIDLFINYKITKVFHLAAVASVAASIDNPLETHETNFRSTLLLLEEAKRSKYIERFVFASSAAVYGDEPSLPKSETSPIKPLSPYAIDKFASEQYVLNYANLYDVPATAVRFFNVYGPRQNPSSPYSGVISILLDKYKQLLINHGDGTFNVFGTGEQTRDFVYVKDVVGAIQLVGNEESSIGNVFNVGTGRETSLLEVIKYFDSFYSAKIKINQLPRRSGDILKSYSDINALKSLGYSPKYSIEEGLKEYLSRELKNLGEKVY